MYFEFEEEYAGFYYKTEGDVDIYKEWNNLELDYQWQKYFIELKGEWAEMPATSVPKRILDRFEDRVYNAAEDEISGENVERDNFETR